MNGLHLVGDLYECACDKLWLERAAEPLKRIRVLCESVGLTVVGERAFEFDGGGYTLATLLAESHVTLHTWPEFEMVAMDVYVCNHTQDNTAKARALSKGLVELFEAANPVIKVIERGEITRQIAATVA
jgi:S-adenosylmethionine/arginine decarboxylase-like enzyme